MTRNAKRTLAAVLALGLNAAAQAASAPAAESVVGDLSDGQYHDESFTVCDLRIFTTGNGEKRALFSGEGSMLYFPKGSTECREFSTYKLEKKNPGEYEIRARARGNEYIKYTISLIDDKSFIARVWYGTEFDTYRTAESILDRK